MIPLSLQVVDKLMSVLFDSIGVVVSLPVRQAVFDVVEGRVDEHAAIIPSARLDADGLVDHDILAKGLVGDSDGYMAGIHEPGIGLLNKCGRAYCVYSGERPWSRPRSR